MVAALGTLAHGAVRGRPRCRDGSGWFDQTRFAPAGNWPEADVELSLDDSNRPDHGDDQARQARSDRTIRPLAPLSIRVIGASVWAEIADLCAVLDGAGCSVRRGACLGAPRRVGAAENQYSPFGFAGPARPARLLANLLLTRSERTVSECETGGRVGDPHRTAPRRGWGAPGLHRRCRRGRREFLFRPVGRALLAPVHAAERLQSGRLEAYLGYCSCR
jgi:hypothetical protein